MKTKLASKKPRQQFIAKATALLLDLGAKARDFDFALQTKAGLLKLHPTENLVEGLGTVFTRFEDPNTAKELVDCNPCSGKWNHHFFAGWSVDSALRTCISTSEDLAVTIVKTIVIFRKDNAGCFALFPELPADNQGYFCTCFQHIGQHCSADYRGCMAQSDPAKPAEYADLQQELEQRETT